MQQQWQRYLAELLGTFVLVFAGTTAIVGAIRSGIPPLLLVPFAFGLALLAGLYAFSEVSGGHYNPAVSLGLFLDRRLDVADLIGYWIAQFTGAILASLVLLLATNKHSVAETATTPASNGAAFVMELVMTAIFVTVILQSSKSDRFGGTRAARDPAHAGRDPLRDHPVQRLVGEPGAHVRAGSRRQRVDRHLDLLHGAAARRDHRLVRAQGHHRGRPYAAARRRHSADRAGRGLSSRHTGRASARPVQ